MWVGNDSQKGLQGNYFKVIETGNNGNYKLVFINYPTQWDKVLMEKLTVAHLVTNFPNSMESRVSVLLVQTYAAGAYPVLIFIAV